MKKHFYLIYIQFIGFRYSGWQKQTNAKTIQEMVDKTFFHVLGHENFKTLGAGRTDAKVSANQFAFELFVKEELECQELLERFNDGLPADIRALSVEEVSQNFKIINDSKIKEYMYIFTSGERIHPFCAPFMVWFPDQLDIDLMMEGAKLFEGRHNFQKYCYKPTEHTEFVRSIDFCEIKQNDIYTANFFPEKSWILNVHGKGFLRHQIRIIMGTLISLGRGDITLIDIKESLKGGSNDLLGFIAASSGLMLHKISFEQKALD